MGRLIAAVIALAVFVTGAMHWSQAEQLQSMPQQPLCPGVVGSTLEIFEVEPAALNGEAAAIEPAGPTCSGKKSCNATAEKSACSKSDCADKAAAGQSCGKSEKQPVDA